MPFRIYRTDSSVLIENTGTPDTFYEVKEGFSFNALFTAEDPAGYVATACESAPEVTLESSSSFAAPIGDQEIWAAGVTYFRSRTARMEEAETAGGDIFYDKVYDADRPELFFKATAPRTRGHEGTDCARDPNAICRPCRCDSRCPGVVPPAKSRDR